MAKETCVTVKELKEDFYTYSSATSARVRELSFAGIAAIWLFRTTIYEQNGLSSELIRNLKLFIVTLGLDFAHALIPSFIYGLMHTKQKLKGSPEDNTVNYNILYELPEWILFIAKCTILIWAYINLLENLSEEIINLSGKKS